MTKAMANAFVVKIASDWRCPLPSRTAAEMLAWWTGLIALRRSLPPPLSDRWEVTEGYQGPAYGVATPEIWDTIAAAPDSLPLTEEDKRLIDERLEACRRNPQAGSSWEDVYARIISRRK
jgi:putative addiction module component (TIGR02574 family)